jgi:hypothetical protein
MNNGVAASRLAVFADVMINHNCREFNELDSHELESGTALLILEGACLTVNNCF